MATTAEFWKKYFWLLPALVILIFAAYKYKQYRIAPSINALELPLVDMQEKAVKVSSFGGHPLMIQYFGTWCGDCRAELPDLILLKEAMADKGLQVILVSDEPLEKLQSFQQMLGPDLTVYQCKQDFKSLGIYTYPTSYLLNSGGEVIWKQTESQAWASPEMLQKVRNLLN
jgi:thiol-disulfide isomerase/thioredoxin